VGKFISICVCAISVVATLFYVRARFLVVELSYEVSQKRTERSQLEQEKRTLSLELATLRNPRRIEQFARTKLQLTQSESKVPKIIVEAEKPR
jgi:cell division protein FtsL